jgi:hypothetical protein
MATFDGVQLYRRLRPFAISANLLFSFVLVGVRAGWQGSMEWRSVPTFTLTTSSVSGTITMVVLTGIQQLSFGRSDEVLCLAASSLSQANR